MEALLQQFNDALAAGDRAAVSRTGRTLSAALHRCNRPHAGALISQIVANVATGTAPGRQGLGLDAARLTSLAVDFAGLDHALVGELIQHATALFAAPATATPITPAGGRKPRARRRCTPRPLTRPQTDAMASYMRCNRNVGAAAAELGISRAAAYDRISAALKKTGEKPLAKRAAKSVRAQALPTDSRGQCAV
ncbi:MAG: hypothetical protein ACP5QA_12080 [Phycisphaerae bacterium]